MMNVKLSLVVLWTISVTFLYGQVKNEKEILMLNKVKTELEKTCTGVCSYQYSAFDQKGNIIEWNFLRLGSICRYIYDKDGNELMNLWIDKLDSTSIDTMYTSIENQKEKESYQEYYDSQRQQLIKIKDSKTIIITFDNQQNPIKRITKKGDKIIATETIRYDSEDRVLEQIVINPKALKNINNSRAHRNINPIESLIERFKYNESGQIIELYTYFSDPCMGLDNHFLYVYNYFENGLLESADVYEEGKELSFSLEYEYEFFEK